MEKEGRIYEMKPIKTVVVPKYPHIRNPFEYLDANSKGRREIEIERGIIFPVILQIYQIT